MVTTIIHSTNSRHRRRGRPRQIRPETDQGTPELQRHKSNGHTQEPLDICLERELISPEQHRAAIRLRWLYTLRYGLPFVTALDLGEAQPSRPERSPEWVQQKENEYRYALKKLEEAQLDIVARKIAVFNEAPLLLHHYHLASSATAHQQMSDFRDAMNILEKIFRAHSTIY